MLNTTWNIPYRFCPIGKKHCANCNNCWNEKFINPIRCVGQEFDFCSQQCGEVFFSNKVYLRNKL